MGSAIFAPFSKTPRRNQQHFANIGQFESAMDQVHQYQAVKVLAVFILQRLEAITKELCRRFLSKLIGHKKEYKLIIKMKSVSDFVSVLISCNVSVLFYESSEYM